MIPCKLCVIYKKTKELEEIFQHLFLKCKISSRIWYLCRKWICIKIVEHKKNSKSFSPLQFTKGDLIWKTIQIMLMRGIWDHINNVFLKPHN